MAYQQMNPVYACRQGANMLMHGAYKCWLKYTNSRLDSVEQQLEAAQTLNDSRLVPVFPVDADRVLEKRDHLQQRKNELELKVAKYTRN